VSETTSLDSALRDQGLACARAIADWLCRCGLDEEGYPLWGVQFEPYFREPGPQMCNHIQGSFQGGCLNVLWQLGQATGVPRLDRRAAAPHRGHLHTTRPAGVRLLRQ
jgi:hypothetical protein